MYSLRGDRGFNFCVCRGRLLPALKQHPAPVPAPSHSPKASTRSLLLSWWDSDTSCLWGCRQLWNIVVPPLFLLESYRSNLYLMSQSMEYCSVHNQTVSVSLEVSRGFKSAPQVKLWADTQPEMAAAVLCVWQCPHTKRSVLLPSSQVPKKPFLILLLQKCLVIA